MTLDLKKSINEDKSFPAMTARLPDEYCKIVTKVARVDMSQDFSIPATAA